jgi:very-short-patch-repair endonuclease
MCPDSRNKTNTENTEDSNQVFILQLQSKPSQTLPSFLKAGAGGGKIMGSIYNYTEQTRYRQHLRTHGTRAELVLWLCLKGRQVRNCKFRRQYGIQIFIVDFYCPELKLAIEVDGISHEDEGRRILDENRQRLIESLGVHFLRFTDEEVLGDAEKVLESIEAEIDRLRSLKSSTTPVSPPQK